MGCKCENCGIGEIEDNDIGCNRCGYRIVKEREGNYFELFICPDCAITYSDGCCPLHGRKR